MTPIGNYIKVQPHITQVAGSLIINRQENRGTVLSVSPDLDTPIRPGHTVAYEAVTDTLDDGTAIIAEHHIMYYQ